jgi:SpoVK/Ycf46/Vps4 family AAA+-type ATPase
MCQDAALLAMRRDVHILQVSIKAYPILSSFTKERQVANEDFLEAAKKARRQITPLVVAKYVQWRDASGLT